MNSNPYFLPFSFLRSIYSGYVIKSLLFLTMIIVKTRAASTTQPFNEASNSDVISTWPRSGAEKKRKRHGSDPFFVPSFLARLLLIVPLFRPFTPRPDDTSGISKCFWMMIIMMIYELSGSN
jgi:hypothetical protein